MKRTTLVVVGLLVGVVVGWLVNEYTAGRYSLWPRGALYILNEKSGELWSVRGNRDSGWTVEFVGEPPR